MYQQNAQTRLLNSNYHKKKTVDLLKQNIEQVEGLLSKRTPLDNLPAVPKQAFTLENPSFTLGQWVDVKDTIGQWLEAQITKIQPEQVFVHFNGWGARWDEWIDKKSPRIAPFRTYTIQSPLTPFLSPYPNIDTDAEDHEIPPSNTTYEDLLIRYLMCSEQIREMIVAYLQTHVKISMQNKLVELCTQLEAQEEIHEESKLKSATSMTLSELTGKPIGSAKEEKEKLIKMNSQMKVLCGQLGPLLDRTGRIMGDMAPHFGSMAYSEPPPSGIMPDLVQFPRFPAASAELANSPVPNPPIGSLECQIPLMPNPAEIAAMSKFTERRAERPEDASLDGLILALAGSGNQQPAPQAVVVAANSQTEVHENAIQTENIETTTSNNIGNSATMNVDNHNNDGSNSSEENEDEDWMDFNNDLPE